MSHAEACFDSETEEEQVPFIPRSSRKRVPMPSARAAAAVADGTDRRRAGVRIGAAGCADPSLDDDELPCARDQGERGDVLGEPGGESPRPADPAGPAAPVEHPGLPELAVAAAGAGTRAKHWLLTVFNRDDWGPFRSGGAAGATCYAYQEEKCERTGRHHIQAYLGFDKQVSFEFIKRMFPSAHAEMARSPIRCFNYCRKVDTRVDPSEFRFSSDPPSYRVGNGLGEPGGDPSPRKERRIDRVLSAIKNGVVWGELLDRFPTEYAEQPDVIHRLFELVKFKELSKPGAWPAPKCAIFYGPPGTGKSSSAALMFKEHDDMPFFRMTIGKWADGYAYEPGILIDDMSPHLVPRAQLLTLMESGLVKWEIKRATVMLAAKIVIITSNYAPEDWFPVKPKYDKKDAKSREEDELAAARADALLRRAAVFYCDQGGVRKVEPSKWQIWPHDTRANKKEIASPPQRLAFSFFYVRYENLPNLLTYLPFCM